MSIESKTKELAKLYKKQARVVKQSQAVSQDISDLKSELEGIFGDIGIEASFST